MARKSALENVKERLARKLDEKQAAIVIAVLFAVTIVVAGIGTELVKLAVGALIGR